MFLLISLPSWNAPSAHLVLFIGLYLKPVPCLQTSLLLLTSIHANVAMQIFHQAWVGPRLPLILYLVNVNVESVTAGGGGASRQRDQQPPTHLLNKNNSVWPIQACATVRYDHFFYRNWGNTLTLGSRDKAVWKPDVRLVSLVRSWTSWEHCSESVCEVGDAPVINLRVGAVEGVQPAFVFVW